MKTLAEATQEYRVWATNPNPRLALGYPIIDERTNGGPALGEVVLFTARSQVGKTTFALNVIENLGGDIPAVFFSLEMNARYLVPRLSAMHTGTPTLDIENAMRAGRVPDAVVKTVQDHPWLAVPDKPAMSLKEAAIVLKEAEDRFGKKVKFVVFDYLELMGGTATLSTLDKIDQLTRRTKDFAREHDVVVLILHQVGRGEGGEGAEPLDIASSRYGGEVAADYVLGAYRPCLRKGIDQQAYLTERWNFYMQFLKTRGGSELHPQGMLHHLDPFSMRLTHGNRQQPLLEMPTHEDFDMEFAESELRRDMA